MKYTLSTNKDNYITISKNVKGTKSLEDISLELILDSYIILKSTNRIKILTKEQFLKSNFGRYLLLPLDYYLMEDYVKWVDYLNKNKIRINYLVAPLPDLGITKFIEVLS